MKRLGGGRFAEVFAMGNGEVRKVARDAAIDLDHVTNGVFFAAGIAFHTGSVGQWTPEPNVVIEAEAKALKTLKHPAFVKLLGEGTDGGRAYLRLEEIKGKSWREAMRAITPAHVRQVAEALAAAGKHGDIKPDNLMLDTAGNVRILDPIGPIGDASHKLLTPAYNPNYADSDLPALGITLLEVLLGEHPLAAANEARAPIPVSQALRDVLQRAAAVGFAPPRYQFMKLAPPSKLQDLALSCLFLRYDGITLDVTDAPANVAEFAAQLK